MSRKKNIFISYKRNVAPDEPLTLSVYVELSKHHNIFIDQTMLVGTKWAEYIENQLRESDHFIIFLSEYSVNSEMVLAEIETAHQLYKQFGKPIILPVRVKYMDALVYPLSAYLNPINYILWTDDFDTTRLVEQLKLSISGKKILSQKPLESIRREKNEIVAPPPSVTPITLELPGGTMNPHSQFFIHRKEDQIAVDAVKQQGVTITIKGPRQVGKSTLLNSVIEAALGEGKNIALLDFQLVERETLSNVKEFYKHFCRWITFELGLNDDVDKFWESPLGNVQLCTRYMREKIIPLRAPLVLAVDEADKVFDTKFRSDFFGMLRNWHNNRSHDSEWKSLDLVLVTSTEPYQLIDDLSQSPFNVGVVIEIQDFIEEQVVELNTRHGSPLMPDETARLFEVLGGHPYLTRKALYLVLQHKVTSENA